MAVRCQRLQADPPRWIQPLPMLSLRTHNTQTHTQKSRELITYIIHLSMKHFIYSFSLARWIGEGSLKSRDKTCDNTWKRTNVQGGGHDGVAMESPQLHTNILVQGSKGIVHVSPSKQTMNRTQMNKIVRFEGQRWKKQQNCAILTTSWDMLYNTSQTISQAKHTCFCILYPTHN